MNWPMIDNSPRPLKDKPSSQYKDRSSIKMIPVTLRIYHPLREHSTDAGNPAKCYQQEEHAD